MGERVVMVLAVQRVALVDEGQLLVKQAIKGEGMGGRLTAAGGRCFIPSSWLSFSPARTHL